MLTRSRLHAAKSPAFRRHASWLLHKAECSEPVPLQWHPCCIISLAACRHAPRHALSKYITRHADERRWRISMPGSHRMNHSCAANVSLHTADRAGPAALLPFFALQWLGALVVLRAYLMAVLWGGLTTRCGSPSRKSSPEHARREGSVPPRGHVLKAFP